MTLKKMINLELNYLYTQRDRTIVFIEEELLSTIDNDDLLVYANDYRQLTKKIRLLEKTLEAIQ